MSAIAKAAPTVGRCGMHCPGLFATSPAVVCALPAGHAGWHRSDEGAEWGISESGLSMDTTEADYERGVAAGRRQAAEPIRRLVDAARTWRAQFEKPVKLPRMAALIAAVDALDEATQIAEGDLLAEAAPAEPVEESDR